MTKAFDKIAAGFRDAIAHAEGDESRARVRVIKPVDVRTVRDKTGMTQDRFASVFNIPVGTLRNWEQGRRRPGGVAVALLRIVEQNPKAAVKALRG